MNITDGVDGLAAGVGTFCFAVLSIMGYWIFRHFSIYHVLPASAIDLSLVAVALAGACIGFLWWNAAPAKIIMGDTGSLAIGAGLAALCLLLNLDLLLLVIGGLFVMETVSVILQVISFRVFHRRIFRMAPIHHHFELGGWPETTVIVRFWILGGLFCALGPRHLLRRLPDGGEVHVTASASSATSVARCGRLAWCIGCRTERRSASAPMGGGGHDAGAAQRSATATGGHRRPGCRRSGATVGPPATSRPRRHGVDAPPARVATGVRIGGRRSRSRRCCSSTSRCSASSGW